MSETKSVQRELIRLNNTLVSLERKLKDLDILKNHAEYIKVSNEIKEIKIKIDTLTNKLKGAGSANKNNFHKESHKDDSCDDYFWDSYFEDKSGEYKQKHKSNAYEEENDSFQRKHNEYYENPYENTLNELLRKYRENYEDEIRKAGEEYHNKCAEARAKYGNKSNTFVTGWYYATIISSVYTENSKRTGYYLKLTFNVNINGKINLIYHYLNFENPSDYAVKMANIDLKKICDAIGKNKDDIEDSSELHGIQMKVWVIKEYEVLSKFAYKITDFIKA